MEGLESNAGLTDAMRIKPDEELQGVAAEADIIAIWLTYTATAITVGFFLSPLPAVRGVWKGTVNFDAINIDSMLLMWLNCICWLVYAVMLPLPAGIPVNAVGLTLVTTYVFIWFARAIGARRAAAWRKVRGAAAMVLGSVAIGRWNIDLLGSVVTVVNITMFGAPLLQIQVVLQERSSRSLPLSTCVVGALCSSTWTLLGMHLQNRPMIIPNVIGTALNLVQVGLCVVFPRVRMEDKKADYP